MCDFEWDNCIRRLTTSKGYATVCAIAPASVPQINLSMEVIVWGEVDFWWELGEEDLILIVVVVEVVEEEEVESDVW